MQARSQDCVSRGVLGSDGGPDDSNPLLDYVPGMYNIPKGYKHEKITDEIIHWWRRNAQFLKAVLNFTWK